MSICPLVTLIFPDAHSPVSSVVRSLVDLRCLCFFFSTCNLHASLKSFLDKALLKMIPQLNLIEEVLCQPDCVLTNHVN